MKWGGKGASFVSIPSHKQRFYKDWNEAPQTARETQKRQQQKRVWGREIIFLTFLIAPDELQACLSSGLSLVESDTRAWMNCRLYSIFTTQVKCSTGRRGGHNPRTWAMATKSTYTTLQVETATNNDVARVYHEYKNSLWARYFAGSLIVWSSITLCACRWITRLSFCFAFFFLFSIKWMLCGTPSCDFYRWTPAWIVGTFQCVLQFRCTKSPPTPRLVLESSQSNWGGNEMSH